MGVVYLAEDLSLHRKVALKFLPPAVAQDPTARARLVREAQAASALDHPHIATIYEIGDWEGQLFIAMAYCAGKTLKDRLAGGQLPIREVVSFGAQIASALNAAHAAGVVHRDLKPANIMVSPEGEIRVLDFGLARLVGPDEDTASRMTVAGTTVGTVAYMSPEQLRGEDVDQRSDIWALGVVLQEMLTGRLPFAGATTWALMQATLADAPAPVLAQRPDTPLELEGLIAAALKKERAARTMTAEHASTELSSCLARLSSPMPAATAPWPVTAWLLRARVLVPTVAVLVALLAAGWWWVDRMSGVGWAREHALPEIMRLADEEQFVEAFDLAVEAERNIPGDRLLAAQWPVISRPATVATTPHGAEVSYRPYGAPDAPWRKLGTTPIRDARMPRGFFNWRIEKPGYEGVDDVGPTPFWPIDLAYTLERAGETPAGMVRVAAGNAPFSVFIPGLDHLPPVQMRDFWIDRHEVTNREFKRFVDEGGYRRRELWRYDFVKDGRRLSWEEGMALLRDSTGRPGPATWETGAYPDGQDDHPVGGVSWYEAVAYAEYAGKALPTIFHWSRAAEQRMAADIVPAGNFDDRGPQAVGKSQAMSRFGAFDMAGNLKEWCWNAASEEKRYILGGAWGEPVYMFTDADAQSPFDRRPTFGFRCVRLSPEDRLAAEVTRAIEFPSRDFSKETPVSDEVFRAFAGLYAYDRTDLAARLESVDETGDAWRREKVTYAAAYGNERVVAHLFLPKGGRPPYQTVVFFPGSGDLQRVSSDREMDIRRVDFIVKSGRALLYPVYKSTFERGDEIKSDYPNQTAAWRDHVVMWSKDLRRSVDYIESRADLAHDPVGFVGFSWGAAMGAILPALEPRLKAAVLLVGGFYLQRALPEADAINFAPRVTIPVLMLNGRYDFFYPTEASQVPMFRLLGAPVDRKRYVVYETGHTIPRAELIRETLDWLDRHLGPVRQP